MQDSSGTYERQTCTQAYQSCKIWVWQVLPLQESLILWYYCEWHS